VTAMSAALLLGHCRTSRRGGELNLGCLQYPSEIIMRPVVNLWLTPGRR
jgi:hypothetical protein